jgi:hypothetical protein
VRRSRGRRRRDRAASAPAFPVCSRGANRQRQRNRRLPEAHQSEAGISCSDSSQRRMIFGAAGVEFGPASMFSPISVVGSGRSKRFPAEWPYQRAQAGRRQIRMFFVQSERVSRVCARARVSRKAGTSPAVSDPHGSAMGVKRLVRSREPEPASMRARRLRPELPCAFRRTSTDQNYGHPTPLAQVRLFITYTNETIGLRTCVCVG